MVFTLPAPIANIACEDKAVVCGLQFDVTAEVLQTIRAPNPSISGRALQRADHLT
jgi:hypothetical protein